MYRHSKRALGASAAVSRQQNAPGVEVCFLEACELGKLDAVQQLLSEDVSLLESRGRLGRTPLMVAAVTGQEDLFKYLLKCGAELLGADDKQDNVLHLASAGGNSAIVSVVLGRQAAGLESRGRSGQTPILKAAYSGHAEVVQLLHEKGGDVAAVDDGGDNVLHVACLGGNVDMIKAILGRKWAELESRGQFGQTPVMKAASMGHVAAFTLLVERGCVLSMPDSNGDNMLHMACLSGSIEIAEMILNASKASIHSRGMHSWTPVMKTASKGHLAMLEYLVAKGANLTDVDAHGDTILHIACASDCQQLVEHLLIRGGNDVEVKGQSGRTPAMMAAYFGQRGVLEFLESKNCNLSALDDYGDTILHIACYGGNVNMVTYLLSKNIVVVESRGSHGRTPLMVAASVGHRDLFYHLLQSDCDLKAVDDDGNNVLHTACMGGSVEMVKVVIGHMKDQIESRGKTNRTPLMLAAAFGHRHVFEYLVKLRVQMSMVDEFGDNILHVACYGGDLDIVTSVLDRVESRVSLESRGKHGRTAAMKAAERGHVGVLNLLVSRGADLTVVDSNNDNILHVICQGGHSRMVEHVVERKICALESRGMFGRTCVLKTAEYGHIETLELLRKLGVNLQVKDTYNDNILHVSVSGGHIAMVRHVLSLDVVSKSSKGKHGRTAILLAAEKGHREVFGLLVAEGCSPGSVDSKGDTILHIACSGGHLDMVQHVVSLHLVHMEARGQFGQTALMKAAFFGHIRVFDWLVGEGCGVEVVDNDRYNLLHVAVIGGNTTMVEHVLSRGLADPESPGKYGRTSVLLAAGKGHIKVLDLLLSKGCNSRIVDAAGDNVLHVACLGGSVDMVQHLIHLDIVGIDSRGQDGMTAVMRAASMGHIEVLELLAENGCSLDALDEGGDNVLHVACLGGSVAMVKHLLSRKVAPLESRGKYGQTPVMKATSMGHKGVFDLLETEGCDLSVLDRDGDNLLHVACYGGNADIVLYLSMLGSVLDVHRKNNAGQTPAQVAEACGHIEMVTLLGG